MSDLKYRGEAMIEILSLTVRKELLQNYDLDLGEMYLLMDYTSLLNQEIQQLRAKLERAEKLISTFINKSCVCGGDWDEFYHWEECTKYNEAIKQYREETE